MAPISVLVVGPSPALRTFLAGKLSGTVPPVEVLHVCPGPGLVEAVRAREPDIAVVDRIDERPLSAQLEIALLKDRCPDVRIIAVSGRSSRDDAGVVEQTLFYYLAGGTGDQLARLVAAAVARVHREAGATRRKAPSRPGSASEPPGPTAG